MKKSIKFLFAALAILTVASCAKEELIAPAGSDVQLKTYTVSFSDTKTSLDGSSVVWTAGDSLWISNGTEVSSWVVPEEAEGQKTFTFTTSLDGDVYVVYPATAAKGVKDGDLVIAVPSTQDGSFSSANICVGKAVNYKVQLHNATAVAKIAVDEAALDVKTLSVSSTGTALSGECKVTFSGGAISAVAPGDVTFGGITVPDASGELYMSIIPGTYPAGFQFSAISEAFTTQTRSTVSAKTLNANNMTDFGTIGTAMAAPAGAGTEGNPYQITNLAEWLALAYYVNADAANTMEGKYFKVVNDIDGITVPVGGVFNNGEEDVDFYFKGNLDGDNKTLKVNLEGEKTVALIGDATAPASFKNVKVAGVAKASGDYAAGLVAMLNGGAGVSFTDCESSVAVSGAGYAGGLVGYNDGISSFTNCVNNGAVNGTGHYSGGISATAVTGTFTSCTNNGAINNVGGQCVGGILGKANGVCSFSECGNTGEITTTNAYTGGILGYVKYFNLTMSECVNSGKINPGYIATSVTSSGALQYTELRCYAGGIVGCVMVQKGTTAFDIQNCVNSGEIYAPNSGGDIGGVAGWIADDGGENGSIFKHNKNTGKVTGLQEALPATSDKPTVCYYTGGVVGWHCRVYSEFLENTGEVDAPAGEYVGGVSGTNRNAKIIDSKNSGNITGGKLASGIVSYQNWSQVQRCDNTGNITATVYRAGGIVADNHKAGSIYNSSNTGNISAPYQVGGIVGLCENQASQNLRNNFNTGAVNSTNAETKTGYAGGLIGFGNLSSQAITIANCYNTGVVTCAGASVEGAGDYMGSLFGYMYTGKAITHCYALETSSAKLAGTGDYAANQKCLMVLANGTFKDGTSIVFEGTKLGDLESSKASESLNNWIINANDAWRTWVFTTDTAPGFGPLYVKIP